MGVNKRYYWLKLRFNFFDDKVIKKLRRIAGGDTFTIIYLKMQLLSLKNEGYIYFDGVENTFEEELALTINEEVENVKVTINFLEQYGLVKQVSEEEYLLTKVPEAIGSETQSAERVRRFRENKKALQSNAMALQCNTEIDIEIEKEIDKDKYIRQPNLFDDQSELQKSNSKKATTAEVEKQFMDIYNTECTNLPKVQLINSNRRKAIKRFLETLTVDDYKTICRNANSSTFCCGGSNSGWKANFDFTLSINGSTGLLEGKYADVTKQDKTKILEQQVKARQQKEWEELKKWAEETGGNK